MNNTQDVIDQMQALGIEGLLASDLVVNGNLHRFRHNATGSKTGWYVLYSTSTSKGEMISGRFGCWKLDINQKVSTKGYKTLGEDERAKLKQAFAKAKAAQELAVKHRAQRAAKRAARTWAKLSATGDSAYLTRKRVSGFRCKYSSRGALVLALRDFKGFIHGLQIIYPDDPALAPKPELAGEKKFWPYGASPKKRFSLIGELTPETPHAVICEGYATGASIHMATGLPVLVAFNAGNLVAVAEQFRYYCPGTRAIIAADDDYLTEGNPGLTKADTAAKRCLGVMAVPAFKNRPEGAKWTDFNDLHVQEGLEAVKVIFDAALAKPEPLPDEEDVPAMADQKERHWMSRFSRNTMGNPLGDILNTTLVLQNDTRWRGVIGYSEFSYRVIKRRAPPFEGGREGEWSDADTNRLRVWLQENYGFTPKNADADGAVEIAAERNSFHPVREYLTGLEWDGSNRLDYWLHAYLGAELNEYNCAVARKWMIAAVARVMEPPCKSDCLMILEGPQGLGKSTALAILGGGWFSDTHFTLGDKDGYQQMQGLWLIELAELDSFNKAESTRAKQFFGSVSDRYRPSYGRRTQEYARQCVFAGTTNQDAYLRDSTGNRRYWPVSVTKMDADALQRDRDQLWAEALHRYRQGVPWHVLEEERAMFNDVQESRFDVDVWEDLVHDWLKSLVSERVQMAEVMHGALKLDPSHMKKPEQMRVGQILHRLGWRKVRANQGGQRVHLYQAPLDWKVKDGEGEEF